MSHAEGAVVLHEIFAENAGVGIQQYMHLKHNVCCTECGEEMRYLTLWRDRETVVIRYCLPTAAVSSLLPPCTHRPGAMNLAKWGAAQPQYQTVPSTLGDWCNTV